ncbi:NAD(P)-binding protein [Auricularia subglabra TFB-10046 SS5]|uniref:NAD(P)-binding protein n=1 Tax=Auricularia subglabra (strain TFB-10046 / SS5) TaxID=717982 RepID=J0LCB5_AURST|nr:NAD(P)-binding protein [Auricularia subglabra TFB-10046 SS5]
MPLVSRASRPVAARYKSATAAEECHLTLRADDANGHHHWRLQVGRVVFRKSGTDAWNRGIGLATTEALLSDGARVVAVHRTSTPELEALGNKHDDSLWLVQGDVTDGVVVKRAVQEAQDVFGGVDTLVLNAGINLPIGKLDKVPLEGWQAMFDVNVFGVVKFLREAIPALRKSDRARVIMLSSEAAVTGIPGAAMYCASKAALNSLSRTLAVEEPNIISVAVDPGRVQTNMMDILLREGKAHIPEEELEAVRETTIQPEVSAKAIAALALRASNALSGKFIQWDDPVVAML